MRLNLATCCATSSIRLPLFACDNVLSVFALRVTQATDLRSVKSDVKREEARVEKLSVRIRRLAKERQEALQVASSDELDVIENFRNEMNEVQNELNVLEQKHAEVRR